MNIERQRRIAALKVLEKESPTFYEIDLKESTANVPSWMTRAFRNNRYMVMVNDNAMTTHGPAIRAMVQKHNNTPILNHWSEMQKIKNLLFGTEETAIEYYPAESKLQNSHNIYWMWIFPPGVIPIAL